jgi:hypothetical protein
MRELRGIGAADADAAAYVQGVRSGGVMIFATGEGEKADTAAGIMNQHFAVEVEELNGSEPHLPSTNADDPARVGSVQVGRVRSPGAGARLFVW